MSQFFFPFFIVLFFVSSVILLISIAGITIIVKISFGDLAQIFLYSLPSTIFFIIPITFVGACVLGLLKLANDYELLVLFSLGISPRRILRFFAPLSVLVSAVMLIFSLALIPIAKNSYERFIDVKRTQIDVNIKPGELGQKLGVWLVYVDSIVQTSLGKTYKDLVLFSNQKEQSFIVSKEGAIENKNGVFSLSLDDGNAYFFKDNEIEKLNFKNMQIRSKNTSQNLSPYDLIGYWKGAFKGDRALKRRFSQGIMTSLFPIVSLFFIPLLGIINPRMQKNRSQILLLIMMITYFVLVHVLSDGLGLIFSLLLPSFWLILGYVLYVRFIKRIY